MVQVTWSMRGAWLLQASAPQGGAGEGASSGTVTLICSGGLVQEVTGICSSDSMEAVALLIFLCTAIVLILCAFAFFREDKEEAITPLCPQLVVREPELRFKLPLESQAEIMSVMDMDDKSRCKVVTDWPDPFRPGSAGVAATVKLQNDLGDLLATVVARNVAIQGQGLTLCKSGYDIFGFVEPDPPCRPRRFIVRHRSGVHLLTLIGDFGALDIDVVNPHGSVVCSFKKVRDECHGRVLQHVDAGLVICALMATHIQRRLTMAVPWREGPMAVEEGVVGETVAEEGASSEEPEAFYNPGDVGAPFAGGGLAEVAEDDSVDAPAAQAAAAVAGDVARLLPQPAGTFTESPVSLARASEPESEPAVPLAGGDSRQASPGVPAAPSASNSASPAARGAHRTHRGGRGGARGSPKSTTRRKASPP